MGKGVESLDRVPSYPANKKVKPPDICARGFCMLYLFVPIAGPSFILRRNSGGRNVRRNLV